MPIAPIFLRITQSLVTGIAFAGKYGGKHAAAAGAKVGGNIVRGFGTGFFKGASAFDIGRSAGLFGKKFIDKLIKITYENGRKALRTSQIGSLAGITGKNLIGAENALSPYGGSAETLAKTMMSLTSKLTGLSFGDAGFLKKAMMYTNGRFNIFGSGPNGFATAQETLDEFARLGKDMEIGRFNELANLLGVDVATRKIIRDGEYDLLKTRQFMTSRDEQVQKKLGMQEAQTAAAWNKVGTLFSTRTAPFFEKWESLSGFFGERIASYMEKSGREGDESATRAGTEAKEGALRDALGSGKVRGWGKKEFVDNSDLAIDLIRKQKEAGIEYSDDELYKLFGHIATGMGFDPKSKNPADVEKRAALIDTMMKAVDNKSLFSQFQDKREALLSGSEVSPSVVEKAYTEAGFSINRGVLTQDELDKIYRAKHGEVVQAKDSGFFAGNLRTARETRSEMSVWEEIKASLSGMDNDGMFVPKSLPMTESQRSQYNEYERSIELQKELDAAKKQLANEQNKNLGSYPGRYGMTGYNPNRYAAAFANDNSSVVDGLKSKVAELEKKLAATKQLAMSPGSQLYSIPRDAGIRESAQVGMQIPVGPTVEQHFSIGSDMRLEVSSPAIDKGQLSPQVQDKIKNDYQNMMQEFWRPFGMKMWGG